MTDDISVISAPAHEDVQRQLELLVVHEALRTSRRSVTFLRYIVEQTLAGNADSLKERTIGVDVFGKPLTYDTNLDHAVRTAASELRRRLTLYYSDPARRDEVRIVLVPGSYVPQFRAAPAPDSAELPLAPQAVASNLLPSVTDENPLADLTPAISPPRPSRFARGSRPVWIALTCLAIIASALFGWKTFTPATAGRTFWQPLFDAPGPVLITVGAAMQGPPTPSSTEGQPPLPTHATSSTPNVPLADAIAIARVSAIFASRGKQTVIRREDFSSFADLRESPVVTIGAFNNEWSLHLTRGLRFSLALDAAQHLIYIHDRHQPGARNWAWDTAPHPAEKDRNSSVPLHDYALITRILDSETGHDVVMLGGLYIYGTEAAAEFLADPDLRSLTRSVPLGREHRVLQMVLETDVTQNTAGPARLVAYSVE